ncbi:CRISPR-associated protein, Cas6 family [Trichormus variabilis ATCC 29413]|uniref:CRISPR-associated protein, Cas6 family n=2 Tax=Anabaena variabilis TaxID=264691 RepID=Q3M5G3_TRIV2|nr:MULTISPECIES: CRISPR-associated endoribonuclease Cas6 [Nostocaceae]ABA23773.1 CRISPR-associated protein, Cas6 family [Trichormus variabilis ATCC 29413]MBC1213927.1 CRISPR-associated endoribonuclease Cas6 [Trichormus variabilis ARAD]MBC1256198.1 CRISPR-associated endoribonuclease Cas6 [Trichormus variabilis V5]MBC1265874.1 CRISPR-associated endoribonuclease Cas6 [Trichormus variabilis FSR]MBC1300341.1 CRISPR-associated endoribonuclease Cas6 [Trichormus variabilis N2B]
MPHSLVLNLLPQSPIPPQYITGRHLHALFLTLVSSVDSTLGDRLHDSTADKAFTLSPLQIKGEERGRYKSKIPHGQSLQYFHQQAIPAGTPCWWRISLLDDTLFSQLTQLWLNLNPSHPWHLGPANLYITSIQGTPQSTQPWANATTYAQLYEQAGESNDVRSLVNNRTLNFTFTTPTAFRQGKFDTTLPTRECVFNSLLSRWNKYSGIEFSEIAIESIFPSFLNIHTEILADSRSKFIGILGEINYRILGDIEPIQIKQINALADFAMYAGIGRKTTMGMGMIRRLYSA